MTRGFLGNPQLSFFQRNVFSGGDCGVSIYQGQATGESPDGTIDVWTCKCKGKSVGIVEVSASLRDKERNYPFGFSKKVMPSKGNNSLVFKSPSPKYGNFVIDVADDPPQDAPGQCTIQQSYETATPCDGISDVIIRE